MDGYGTSSWTCGECGEVFAADGVVGDLRVMRWRREHKEEHRIANMTDEERAEHYAQHAARYAGVRRDTDAER